MFTQSFALAVVVTGVAFIWECLYTGGGESCVLNVLLSEVLVTKVGVSCTIFAVVEVSVGSTLSEDRIPAPLP